jgi:hypothetical protein
MINNSNLPVQEDLELINFLKSDLRTCNIRSEISLTQIFSDRLIWCITELAAQYRRLGKINFMTTADDKGK